MAPKATIKDVARLAEVSPSTVSRALRDNPRISEEVRARVRRVAKELDFHLNQMARSLVKRETRIVGVLFAESASTSMGHPFYPAVLQGLGKVAGERRYHMLLSTGAENMSEEDAMRDMADSGFASGLICLATLTDPNANSESIGLPMVEIGHPLYPERSYYVDNDNVLAGYEATKYLLERGHRRILFLGYDGRFFMMVNRLKGFRQAMAEYGIPVHEDWVVPAKMIENTPDFIHLGEIFRADARPTAVVSMDDPLSVGLNGFLLTLGLSVPADVSVVSFNNTQVGQYHSPALTSIDVHPRELGMHAMTLLINMIKGAVEEPTHVDVPFTLVERDSVAAIRQE
ncbi:MAG TPA: LacI family DNA-binding transcriptional regulator [Candidatus Limiplasma sp.]|nr:LacI family DNA-binding transcriptional regulator [Candidatus Limiplasma sp.]HPS82283.1 LacI family DNA-binding transcriptional regulator [Candidatus Limiplasma sp.]